MMDFIVFFGREGIFDFTLVIPVLNGHSHRLSNKYAKSHIC